MSLIKKIFCEDVKLFTTIRKNFKGGLIVSDDARTYLTSRDEPYRRMVMRRRQMNSDVFFICHGFSEFPPSCNFSLTDVILFETIDERDKWNIANPKFFYPYADRVNAIAKTNPYYYEHIVLRETKLKNGKRRQKYTLFVGAPGCGKTTMVVDIMNKYVSTGKPVLAVLGDDEEELFWEYPELTDSEHEEDIAWELRNFG